MSVIKSQIHDGFATIRTRGLHRSRSRGEQWQHIKPTIVTKSDSMPLYENNNDLSYNYKRSTIEPSSDTNTIIDNNHYSRFSTVCSSFKEHKSNTPPPSSNELRDYERDILPPPPPAPCDYKSYENSSNSVETPQSPDSIKSNEYFLYTRPESPQYGQIGLIENTLKSEDYANYSSKYKPSYYRSIPHTPPPPEIPKIPLEKIITRPPIKSNSLQYRKSYSHPSKTIYEDFINIDKEEEEKAAQKHYNSSTNYLEPSKLNESALKYGSIQLYRNLCENGTKSSYTDRRYATLAYPKEAQRNKQHRVQQQNYDYDLEYLDPLDCKIGCQTTLRSKPRIPWYELAIRKDNRRQSCPPIEAHVVAAFEQSLTNMTQRLQQLSATADRKDGELTEMRQTIELLRKQSIQAGLTSAHMHSMNEHPNRLEPQSIAANNTTIVNNIEIAPAATSGPIQRHHSSDSMCSLNSLSSGCSAQDKKKKKGWLRSSFTKAFSRNAKISKAASRNVSTSSNLDTTPVFNNTSSEASSLPPPSPTKSPHKMVTVIENAKPVDALDIEGNPIVEDLKKQLREKDLVLTDIRLEALSSASQLESLKDTVVKMRQEMMNLKQNNERLQKLVTSRSLAGSEVSLGGPISPNGSMGEPRRYSLADGNLRPPLELPKSLEETEEENIPPAPAPEPPPPLLSPTSHSELTPPPPAIESSSTNATNEHITTPAEDVADHTDGKKISIVVYLGQPESFAKYAEEVHDTDHYFLLPKPLLQNDKGENAFEKPKSYVATNRNEFTIAYTYISGKTTWQNLDYIVRKTFKDYLARIDPGTNLGLNTDSITSYHLGDAKRGPEMGFPELLPCGYIIGNVKSLYICLQGVGSLAFESLIPRSIVHRYISLLTEHRRLILCGPSGTGKSYLARKLAEFLVSRSQRGNPSEAIATFNVDHKSSKELRQYLGHIAEQASMSNGVSELPSVIILDNLHHASALGEVFQVLLSAGPAAKLPCIIGTMSQATCNTTNLQLHHNFRWVLTANHMEPVKGFLSRFLRRRLFSMELATHSTHPQLAAVLAWLPTVWQHINRFLETHSSSDVTIGPRLFLSCPLDLADSQVWFTDVWNYHLEPYLVEAVREGVQLYGRRGGVWVDPSTFIRDTYPWPIIGTASIPPLRLINAEDVGLEGSVTGNLDSQDPLLNMLMRLQEAANYSGNQEQESDCASLDSNITQDSSAGAE